MSTLEDLETKLLENPSARARFLADTLELLERNGVDVGAVFGTPDGAASLDLTDGNRFLGGLAASSIVITRSSTGKGALGPGGAAASTLVITRSSTGKGAAAGGPTIPPGGAAASTLVITRSSTGKGVTPGGNLAASTVVITRSSTGRLATLADQLRQVAGAIEQESLELGQQEEALRQETGAG